MLEVGRGVDQHVGRRLPHRRVPIVPKEGSANTRVGRGRYVWCSLAQNSGASADRTVDRGAHQADKSRPGTRAKLVVWVADGPGGREDSLRKLDDNVAQVKKCKDNFAEIEKILKARPSGMDTDDDLRLKVYEFWAWPISRSSNSPPTACFRGMSRSVDACPTQS